MAGTRFTIAAALMLGLIYLAGQYRPMNKAQFFNAAISGILFLGVGTGGTAWALQYIDTGFASLLISTEPLIVVLMTWGILEKRPSNKSFFGVALGLVGAYLLVAQDELVVNPNHWWALLAILVSITTWGYATILVSKSDMPPTHMMSTGVQLFAGGMFLLFISLCFGEKWVDMAMISNKALYSMGFLIIFGSVIVFTAFNYLLKQVSPAKVATGTYVNPIIALVLGWLFAGEVITGQSIIATAVLLSGVFLINSGD